MKRTATVFSSLLLIILLLAPVTEIVAQIVHIDPIAITPKTRVKPTTSATDSTYWATLGLSNVPPFVPIYLNADTTGSTTAATGFTWVLTAKPTGSTATLFGAKSTTTAPTTANISVNFKPDSVGMYIVTVTVAPSNASHSDTVIVEKYAGVSATYPGCGACHAANYNTWKLTNHATIYNRAIRGMVEAEGVPGAVNGVYKESSCAKCHTTGYDKSANNGNYGYLAYQSGWDTTWHKPYPEYAGEDIIPYGDSTAVKLMNSTYPQLVNMSTIGCESCHGPMSDHPTDSANKYKRGKTFAAGACNYCHDSSAKHSIGAQHATSNHGKMPVNGHASSTSCYPCHSGTAFVKFVNKGADTTGIWSQWSVAADGDYPVTCAVCHDPHDGSKPAQLRTVTAPAKFKNGETFDAPVSGSSAGRVCMTCHSGRYGVNTRITTTAPYYGFTDRFGPHYSAQADMLLGHNGYQYGDTTLTGITTHAGLTNECATCHMPVLASTGTPKHTFSMTDTTGGLHDVVDACKACHGANITTFDDIKAAADYDRDGKIEGVQSEITGLLALVKSKLPKDAAGEPVTMRVDSLKVKGLPKTIQDIYNYYFVKNDFSMGVHNTKYAVALLTKAMGWTLTDVKMVSQKVPTAFELGQNYPNPFNPSTSISFSIPRQEHVVIAIYDMLGKEVNRIVDNTIAAGTFKATWKGDAQNGEKVPSGVYFYRIQAGSFSAAKKMLMLK